MERGIIEKTEEYMKNRLSGDSSGHDWWHTKRVWELGKKIAAEEGAYVHLVEVTCLLHDIADHKLHGGDEEIGPRLAGEWLQSLSVKPSDILHIREIISTMSYKGPNYHVKMKTLEGKCVQDADALDAMGAIGVARCFAFGGYKGNLMYNPAIPPNRNLSTEQYKKAESIQINHFYEKLLLLKDRLNTRTARKIAEQSGKHKFMGEFLNQFFKEWNL